MALVKDGVTYDNNALEAISLSLTDLHIKVTALFDEADHFATIARKHVEAHHAATDSVRKANEHLWAIHGSRREAFRQVLELIEKQ